MQVSVALEFSTHLIIFLLKVGQRLKDRLTVSNKCVGEENLMRNTFIIFLGAMLLVACSNAQKSSEVTSIRIPIAPYLKMDCKELATEQNQLVREAELLRDRVDDAYDSDKTTEVVTWLLFAPAAFMLDGNSEEAAELAAVKGQLEAVREAQQVNGCSL